MHCLKQSFCFLHLVCAAIAIDPVVVVQHEQPSQGGLRRPRVPGHLQARGEVDSFTGEASQLTDHVNNNHAISLFPYDGQPTAQEALKARELASDFDWDISWSDTPVIMFSASSSTNEVRLLYTYTGKIVDGSKYLTTTLFRADCSTPASTTALALTNSPVVDSSNQKYTVDVDILQATIASSSNPEYVLVNSTTATITFCVRVDYKYVSSSGVNPISINFDEQIVTAIVNLSGGTFTLTGVTATRNEASNAHESTVITCHIKAYLCDSNNAALTDPTYAQGSVLTVCVTIADVDANLYHVTSVLSMRVNQTKHDGVHSDQADIVIADQATSLSEKTCSDGICVVRHQLASKFFDESSPMPLVISGIAACGLGTVVTNIGPVPYPPPISAPSAKPSLQPQKAPSAKPSYRPQKAPSAKPSWHPLKAPSAKPSRHPHKAPSARPSRHPHKAPSAKPSRHPHKAPSAKPSHRPNMAPSAKPSHHPNMAPSAKPSRHPHKAPSAKPSRHPHKAPSAKPSRHPHKAPSAKPSARPVPIPVGPFVLANSYSGHAPYEYFGGSVDLEYNTVVVGANAYAGYDLNGGAAYVYTINSSNQLTNEKRLVPSDQMLGAFFGWKVAISGPVIAVSALTGAVYLFRLQATGNFVQEAKVTSSDGTVEDNFGLAIALDKNILAVGSPQHSGTGAVYIFEYDSVGSVRWPQKAKISNTFSSLYFFGNVLALQNKTLVVGSEGRAFVYNRDTLSGWIYGEELQRPSGYSGTDFGYDSIDLSGNTVVLGATDANNWNGGAFVFGFSATSGHWSQQASLVAGDGAQGDEFGTAVAVSGNVIIVGAFYNDADKGAAYQFALNSTSGLWYMMKKITVTNSFMFGLSVAIYGRSAVVGQNAGVDSYMGSISLYTY